MNQPPQTHDASALAPAVLLEPDALNRLRELDPLGQSHLISRVLTAFDNSLQRMLPELVAAGREPVWPTVRLIAHTLKSSAATIGATAMTRQCAEIEAMARDEQMNGLTARIDAMLVEAARVREALQQVPERNA